MYRQEVIWTALPNGVLEGMLRLSLYLAPRLTSDDSATLADFPDLLLWPRTLLDGAVRFELEIEGGDLVPIEPIGLDLLDPVRWGALFRPEMPVNSFEF